MRIRTSAFLTVTLLFQSLATSGLNAQPKQLSVGDLHDFCVGIDDLSKSVCKFYIVGVFEGAKLSASLSKDRSHICIPDDFPDSKMQFMVKTKIGEDLMLYPADRELAAAGFILAVVIKGLPCTTPAKE